MWPSSSCPPPRLPLSLLLTHSLTPPCIHHSIFSEPVERLLLLLLPPLILSFSLVSSSSLSFRRQAGGTMDVLSHFRHDDTNNDFRLGSDAIPSITSLLLSCLFYVLSSHLASSLSLSFLSFSVLITLIHRQPLPLLLPSLDFSHPFFLIPSTLSLLSKDCAHVMMVSTANLSPPPTPLHQWLSSSSPHA